MEEARRGHRWRTVLMAFRLFEVKTTYADGRVVTEGPGKPKPLKKDARHSSIRPERPIPDFSRYAPPERKRTD